MNTVIKTIFFDLGNVLVKFDPVITEKGYRAYGDIKEGEITSYILDSDNINKYAEGKLTSSQFYSKTRRLFRMDISFTEFYRIWNSMFYPFPEMEKLVETIKKKYPDLRLMVVSNTNEVHFEFLKKEYKVLSLMDQCVVSHGVGRQKPHFDIFNTALKIAGTKPKEVFYTDDRQDLIDAARIMGIHAFQFTGPEELRKQLARYEIHA